VARSGGDSQLYGAKEKKVSVDPSELSALIVGIVCGEVAEADTKTQYREPLVGFAAADDARWADVQRVVTPVHMLPQQMLPGARSVVSFFLPFESSVVEENALRRGPVAREWAVAYVETNALIGWITRRLIESLAPLGIRGAAEPATYNFDPVTLISQWSHKSVAVIAGLGSLGVHHLVITEAGCAGRFGSVVIDADLPVKISEGTERCLYYHDGSCLECVSRCPIGALDPETGIDKQRCWTRCQAVAMMYAEVGKADVCGKCTLGPCATQSAV
jgi:epoxyqueuosine reductase